MKRACRGAYPGKLQTWSAAGELQPGRPCCRFSSNRRALSGGEYLPLVRRTEGFRPQARFSGAPPERTEPTPLLNHETSDHLLSPVETTCPAWAHAIFESSESAKQVL